MPATSHFAPQPGKISSSSQLGSTSVVSVTALAGVSGFVRDAYGERVLGRANQAAMLDIEAIEDQDCFIPHATMTTFADTVAKLSGEEFFGLILAPHLSIANYGCWGEYILAAPTLGEAIQRGGDAIGFHSKGDALSIDVSNGEARLSYFSAAKGHEGYEHVACGSAGVIVSICKAFFPADWRPRRVELDIPRPGRPWVFEDVFQCPVIFDAPTVSVCVPARQVNFGRRLNCASSLLTIQDLARARVECLDLNSLRDVIAQQNWSQVLAGSVSIESAARSLDTSVRTLQRELNREGTDFRRIRYAMRNKRAAELLRHSDASITTIAMMLGYSEPSHFARAFRKATRMSPKEFRLRSAFSNPP